MNLIMGTGLVLRHELCHYLEILHTGVVCAADVSQIRRTQILASDFNVIFIPFRGI